MKQALRDYLSSLARKHPRLTLAAYRQEAGDWQLDWASNEQVPPLPPEMLSAAVPTASLTPREGAHQARGIRLISCWETLGVVVWSDPSRVAESEVWEALLACQAHYFKTSECRWRGTTSALLSALKEQRRELATAIHRGPAQALTAARLELSMLETSGRATSLARALEEASEGLVQLVHGQLRSRGQEESLLDRLRCELEFRARWQQTSTGSGDTLTLPREGLTDTLAKLWEMAGGKHQESAEGYTFFLHGAPV